MGFVLECVGFFLTLLSVVLIFLVWQMGTFWPALKVVDLPTLGIACVCTHDFLMLMIELYYRKNHA